MWHRLLAVHLKSNVHPTILHHKEEERSAFPNLPCKRGGQGAVNGNDYTEAAPDLGGIDTKVHVRVHILHV